MAARGGHHGAVPVADASWGAGGAVQGAEQLATQLGTATAQAVGDANWLSPALVQALPEAARNAVVAAYHDALTPVFGYLVALFAIGFQLALLLPEKELAARASDTHDADPPPGHQVGGGRCSMSGTASRSRKSSTVTPNVSRTTKPSGVTAKVARSV